MFSKKALSNNVIFSENFDDASSINNWEPIMGTINDWIISNGRIGARASNNKVIALVPKEEIWNFDGGDYLIEIDMFPVAGEDKNFDFRYQSFNEYYEIHYACGDFNLDKRYPNEPFTRKVHYPIQNNFAYHLKILAKDDHLVFDIKNLDTNQEFRIFDVIDQGTSLKKGKVAIKVGTGSIPVEVWFDNLVVTRLDDPPDYNIPVVLVPGLGASINFKEMFLNEDDPDGWKMIPGANVYDNIIDALGKNSSFYVFNYDWRRPVTDNVQSLFNFLENIATPPTNTVNIVGHSLGGLISRTCVQTMPNKCFVNKLITVGSPHHGSVDAYAAIEGGEIRRKGLIKLYYELFVHYYQKPGETKKETLIRIVPVLKDLLPIFDFLKRGENIVPTSSLSITNDLLYNLQDLSNLFNITTTISGSNYLSSEYLIIENPDWIDNLLGNWQDGKPIETLYSNKGDTSVLLKSSSFNNPNIENFTFDLDHAGIISDQQALNKIFQLLELTFPNNIYTKIDEAENFLVFFVHSPVKISLNNNYQGFNNEEIIIIPNPNEELYQLTIEGLENGNYSFSVGQIIGEKVFWSDYEDTIERGEQKHYDFTININDPQENPLVDDSGIITKELLIKQINNILSDIKLLDLNPIYSKSLIRLLKKIELRKKIELSILNDLYQIRILLTKYERQNIIDYQTTQLLRNKLNKTGELIELLLFKSPHRTNRQEIENLIFLVKKINNEIVNFNRLDKSSVLIYLEAQKKLSLSEYYFSREDYFRSKVYAIESRHLFWEAIN